MIENILHSRIRMVYGRGSRSRAKHAIARAYVYVEIVVILVTIDKFEVSGIIQYHFASQSS
jgi:predicted metallopeptidase